MYYLYVEEDRGRVKLLEEKKRVEKKGGGEGREGDLALSEGSPPGDVGTRHPSPLQHLPTLPRLRFSGNYLDTCRYTYFSIVYERTRRSNKCHWTRIVADERSRKLIEKKKIYNFPSHRSIAIVKIKLKKKKKIKDRSIS